MNSLLHKLVGYSPDRDARGPLKEKKERTRTQSGGAQLPDNVKPNLRTKWLEQSLSEGDSLVWQNLKSNGLPTVTGRDPELNENEVRYIEEFQEDWEYLLLDKAQELKPYWAAGYSAKECALAYEETRGYSKATCDKYWRLFFIYHSPIE